MQLSPGELDSIQQEIIRTTLDHLDKGDITPVQMSEIAGFVLDNSPSLTTHEALTPFLSELAQKWSIFGSIKFIEAGREQEKQVKQVVNNASAMISSGNLDEALQTLKAQTQSGGDN